MFSAEGVTSALAGGNAPGIQIAAEGQALKARFSRSAWFSIPGITRVENGGRKMSRQLDIPSMELTLEVNRAFSTDVLRFK